MNTKTGKVYLVGAGPGDPGLISLKGADCIKKADVIVYDYLASSTFLEFAPPDAEIIYVGKKGGDHTLSQAGINDLLVEKALQGAVVTRLKGGDPFIFGRGGEEAEVLRENGIEFEIVPGVTSAIAAPAYAGIPLSHREYTSTIAFITGHEDPTKTESQIDWQSLAVGIGTLVFLMGVKNLPNIVRKLMENGMKPDTPAAVIRWGTTQRQATVEGTLETIHDRVTKAGLKAPAIIIIGDVVQLREKLKWFGPDKGKTYPLLGKKIVVTRARAQASDLVKRLSDLGAECLEFPTIEIVPPENWEPLDTAIDNLKSYEWIIFTSVNGVIFFFRRLFEKGKDVRCLHHIRTAAIGPATAQKLSDFGFNSDIVPESYRAESIVEAFKTETIKGHAVLLPRAEQARPILPVELRQLGASVDEVVAYRTVQASLNREKLIRQLLKSNRIDWITFTSSSTARNFKDLMQGSGSDDLIQLIGNTRIASIGPITTETAEKLGFNVHVTAAEYTIPGLCDAITSMYDK